MPDSIVGWDIGGAHLKAAIIDRQGRVLKVILHACPLWKGLTELQQAVHSISRELTAGPVLHALTMTGELVDLFDSREQGVRQIIEVMAELLGKRDILVFAGTEGFIPPDSVTAENCERIASANWLASACYLASQIKSALLIDIGSTTTDILVVNNGRVSAQGETDYQRLCSGELVYTGIVRTPVMAIARQLSFEGKNVGLMAEYFATMADVYRLTGELNELHDRYDAADGGAKTLSASARRLARMIGCDFDEIQMQRWRKFAVQLRDIQLSNILHACTSLLSERQMTPQAEVVGAGIGRFLAKDLACHLGYEYRDFSDLFKQNSARSGITIADCAPAVSVASLALACR